MTDVDELPAFDRVQQRSTPPSAPSSSWLRWLVPIGLLLAVAVWWVWPTALDTEDLLLQLATTADAFQPDLATTAPDEARAFIIERLGWDVPPPDLPNLALVGAGLPAIGTMQATAASQPSDIQIPAFRYEGSAGERAVVFAYDYILLDRIRDRYDLPEGTYAGLSEPTPLDSRVVDGIFVVTWRQRAMVFSAVTASEELADLIRQAVSA